MRSLASIAFVLLSATGVGAQPDVLLITIDTLRADRLGCYGHHAAATPVLDDLAEHAVRFDQCQSPTPITLPSHATILTGQSPPGHGVRNNTTYRLGDGVPTLAEALSAVGYTSGAFVAALPLAARFGLDRGFDVYDDSLPTEESALFQFRERSAPDVNAAALEWLASRSSDESVFVWVHYFEPHAPYEPRGVHAQLDDPYDGEVAAADEAVGELLKAWDARRTRPRITVVTSDHGEGLGEHGEESHSMYLYQTTLRVPLLIQAPGLVPRVVPEPVGLIDVAPTVLALAGVSLDGLEAEGIPLSNDAPPRRDLYSETLVPWEGYRWSPAFALRRGDAKVIRSARTRAFDLESDPAEVQPLASAAWTAEMIEAVEARVGAPSSGDTRQPTPEELEALASLGYVGSTPATADPLLDLLDSRPDAADCQEAFDSLQEAEAALATKDFVTASRHLESVLDHTPDNVWGHVLSGRAALGADDVERAVVSYETAASLEPRWLTVQLNLARLRARLQRGEAAREAYGAALELSPHDADLRLEVAGHAQQIDDLVSARITLEDGLRLHPNEARFHGALARLHLQRGDIEKGWVSVERARDLAPADFEWQVLAAVYLQRQSRWAEIETLLASQPPAENSGLAQQALGFARQMLGKNELARGHYERALSLDDDLHLAHNNLGWMLATARDPQGLVHARRAVELLPQEPEYHDTLLEALESVEGEDAAREYLRSIRGRFADHPALDARARQYGLD